MNSLLVNTIKLFTWDLFYSFGSWPLWWYGKGLGSFFAFVVGLYKRLWNNLALPILIKSWFKPMYAQYDWQGRIISFFFRTLLIWWRLFIFLVIGVFYFVLLVLWVALPPIAIIALLAIIFSS